MIERRLADTNLIIRYLLQDHPKHSAVATKIFDACENGSLILEVRPEVLAECVFVLESFYKCSRKDIAQKLSRLISCSGIHISNTSVHVDALERYCTSKAHFVDCTVAAFAVFQNESVATFDTDFRKFLDVTIALD